MTLIHDARIHEHNISGKCYAIVQVILLRYTTCMLAPVALQSTAPERSSCPTFSLLREFASYIDSKPSSVYVNAYDLVPYCCSIQITFHMHNTLCFSQPALFSRQLYRLTMCVLSVPVPPQNSTYRTITTKHIQTDIR